MEDHTISLRLLFAHVTFIGSFTGSLKIVMASPALWPILVPFVTSTFGLLIERNPFGRAFTLGLYLAILACLFMLAVYAGYTPPVRRSPWR